MDVAGLQDAVFKLEKSQFNALAMEVFQYQSRHCEVYQQYLKHLQVNPSKIINPDQIPYLPIQFFKQFEIQTNRFEAEQIFESSSTTGTGISRHFVKEISGYIRSFKLSFERVFGNSEQFCHLALLPSYLERSHSSLVYQVNYFIEHSLHIHSSFFLNNLDELAAVLQQNEKDGIPTILWGVSFALLDFAEAFQFPLQQTIMIETGGMKGRRKEITRQELHGILKTSFSLKQIASEYGMTECLSQAYSLSDGLYRCPPWMKVQVREINDPFGKPLISRHGAVNIADLANLNSCAFISTSDLGKVYEDGCFEILGRLDYSDTRGCNLLV